MKKTLPVSLILMLAVFISHVSAQSNVMPVDSATRIAQFKKNIERFTNDLNHASDTKSQGTLHMLLGVNEAALKQYNTSINNLTAAIKLYPELQMAYVYRATSFEAVKNYDGAIKDYETCLGFVKNNNAAKAGLYNGIAKLQLRLRQFDKVIESDSIALALVPQLNDAHLNRAWAYLATAKYQDAIDDFIKGMVAYQTNKNALAAIYVGLGDAYRKSKQYKPAINNYSTALQLNPDNKLAYWNLAASYNMNGDYQLADENYTTAITFYKGDDKNLSRLYNDRALMEVGQQQFKRAIDDCTQAIALDEKFAPAYWDKADAYAQNADFQLSIDYYTKTASFYQEKKKALAQLYNDIANEEYFLNDYQKVIDYSTSCITLDGSVFGAFLNRGRAYLKKNENVPAMADFGKVLVLDTTKKSFEYAFALFYTGKPDQAIAIMQGNLLSSTNNYVLMSYYYNLACLFSLMNKTDEANTYLKKCIDGGYPKQYALNDADLENIRSTQEFKSYVK